MNGQRYKLWIPSLPDDHQPDVVLTVREVRDGIVTWTDGSMSPASLLVEEFETTCIPSVCYRRVL